MALHALRSVLTAIRGLQAAGSETCGQAGFVGSGVDESKRHDRALDPTCVLKY